MLYEFEVFSVIKVNHIFKKNTTQYLNMAFSLHRDFWYEVYVCECCLYLINEGREYVYGIWQYNLFDKRVFR